MKEGYELNGQGFQGLYRAIARAICLGFALYLLITFLDTISLAILLFLLAFILAAALNVPVVWLEKHGVPRAGGTAIVLVSSLALVALISWLVIPRIAQQLGEVVDEAPRYIESLNQHVSKWLGKHPMIEQQVKRAESSFSPENASNFVPNATKTLLRVGRHSLSIIVAIFLLILVFSIVMYTLVRPDPLLKGLLRMVSPGARGATERALIGSSDAVIAWLWSNVIVGAMEAVLAGIVLSFLNVPAALVWAGLTFFAELIPNIGSYIMSVPPILMALAVDPMTALWVTVFYIVLQQVFSHFVTPWVRSSKMNLHPVILIFFLLAMAMAFGFLGAILSTPVAGIAAAFYHEFFLAKRSADPDIPKQAERILRRQQGGNNS